MNKYKIVYTILTALTISPLEAIVCADDENQAKAFFLSDRHFYSSNDPDQVVIESIRKI